MGMFSDIITAVKTVNRNKRRSLAMIAGIILGTLILSGIVLYLDVLQQQNFETIVNNAPYEVSIRFADSGTEAQMWDLVQQINNDASISKRVEAATVLTTTSSGFDEHEIMTYNLNRDSTSTDGTGGGNGNVQIETDIASRQPIFVRDNFTQNQIMYKIIENGIEGKFDISVDGGIANTVISENLALSYNLIVGDIIDNMTISYIENPNTLESTRLDYNISQVRIAGIYSPAEANAGIFSQIFSSENIFLNINALGNNTSLPAKFNKNSNYILAIKINKLQFELSDIQKLNRQISILINDITKLSGETVIGENTVSGLLLPFQILNVFLTVFNIILVLPIIILSLNLLLFGLELSLEERKKEIGIFKVQGADSKQIFKMLRTETLVIFFTGLAIGYVLAMFGAWVIASAIGFMKFNFQSLENFRDFVSFQLGALLWAMIPILAILIFAVYKKGRSFIELEVSEAVAKKADRKIGFMRRNRLDIFMVLFGGVSAIYSIVYALTETKLIPVGDFMEVVFIRFFGVLALWIGGSIFGARVAKWIPQKVEKQFLNLPKMKNVSLIIKSGLKRRGDIDRLVIIIVLTLSIATLAASQGVTDEHQSIRQLQYEIGSDMNVAYLSQGNYTSTIAATPGVSMVSPLPIENTRILSTQTQLAAYDPAVMSQLIWHEDSLKGLTLDEVKSQFVSSSSVPVVIGKVLAEELDVKAGATINFNFQSFNLLTNQTVTIKQEVVIIGLFDHAPGGVGDTMAFTSFDAMISIRSLIQNKTLTDIEGTKAKNYFVNANNDQLDTVQKSLKQLQEVVSVRNLQEEIDSLDVKANYGIPGLLTMMFLTSLTAAIVGAFSFSAIIMERRRREFAVLQTVGGSIRQVYLISFGENFLVMFSATLYGILIGLGLTYQMNGIFSFLSVVLGGSTLPRLVIFPIGSIALIGFITLLGMLSATLLSARSSANQDLSIATKEV